MKFNILVLISIFTISCAQTSKKNVSQKVVHSKNEFVSLKKDPYKIKGVCPKFVRKKHMDLTLKRLKDFINVCVKQGKYERARKYSQVILLNYKDSPWGYYYLSLISEGQKNYELALWMIDNAQNIQNSSGLFHYQRGRVKQKMGDMNGAMAEMQRAVSKDNKLVAAHTYLGQMYSASLQHEKAMGHYEYLLEKNINDFDANVGMADSNYYLKKYKPSLKFLNRAIKIKPKNLNLRLKRAQIYYKRMNDYPKALSLYKKIKILLKEKKLKGVPSFSLNQKIAEVKKLIPDDIGKKRNLSSLKSKGSQK